MGALAEILGRPEFDINAPSGSVPVGDKGAAGSGDGSNRTSADDGSARIDGGGNADSTRRSVNPASATPDADDNAGSNDRRGNTRRARNSSARADANTRTRTRKESTESDLDITALLVVIHAIVSRVLNAPEFEVSEDEAKILGQALKRVMKYVTKSVLSPFQEAVGGLVVIVLALYLPRYFIYAARTGGKNKTITVEKPSVN